MSQLDRGEFDALVMRLEKLIQERKLDDEDIQRALLEVARNHIWKSGLMTRIKWTVNVIGALGIIGGGIMVILTFFGFEIIRTR
jgi:hypothetical protein